MHKRASLTRSPFLKLPSFTDNYSPISQDCCSNQPDVPLDTIMVRCNTQKKVPITNFDWKIFNELLDIWLKIGRIRLLSSDLALEIGGKMFPNVRLSSKFPRIQHSTSDLCCNALVPFGTARQPVEENGREKDRLTSKFLFVGFSNFRLLSFLNNSVKNFYS
jgi:hypothetical protein